MKSIQSENDELSQLLNYSKKENLLSQCLVKLKANHFFLMSL